MSCCIHLVKKSSDAKSYEFLGKSATFRYKPERVNLDLEEGKGGNQGKKKNKKNSQFQLKHIETLVIIDTKEWTRRFSKIETLFLYYSCPQDYGPQTTDKEVMISLRNIITVNN